jgi:hypothetical protein
MTAMCAPSRYLDALGQGSAYQYHISYEQIVVERRREPSSSPCRPSIRGEIFRTNRGR